MANRLRVTVVVALAMLNVLTLGAGVAVARMLPGRLALWRIPRVTTAPLTRPLPVLAPATRYGPTPARAGLAAVLAPLLASPSLSSHTGAIVVDPVTGRALFSQAASSFFTPASSAKLTTAEAALSVLGPTARFTTRVVLGVRPGSVVLVGGGDPTLAAGHPPASDYPQPATLVSLAGATARWLRAHGRASVRLGYDISLFSGPLMAPGWTTSYVTTGNVTPITSLEVDQGRLTSAGKPQDADNPDNYRPRSFTPSVGAARAFASFLRARGIRVLAGPRPAAAPEAATTIASVRSPMLSAIVAQMLRESNNVIAEDLARQVALRMGEPATFSGGAAAVTAALTRLGIRSGVHLVDGSGLSPEDQITPRALATLVLLAASGRRAALSPVIAGLPVAGFSGTLARGQMYGDLSVGQLGHFGPAALGMVRAKTGDLSQVVTLTGLVEDADGHLLAFAFMADRFPPGQLDNAAQMLDTMATVLAGCGCR